MIWILFELFRIEMDKHNMYLEAASNIPIPPPRPHFVSSSFWNDQLT